MSCISTPKKHGRNVASAAAPQVHHAASPASSSTSPITSPALHLGASPLNAQQKNLYVCEDEVDMCIDLFYDEWLTRWFEILPVESILHMFMLMSMANKRCCVVELSKTFVACLCSWLWCAGTGAIVDGAWWRSCERFRINTSRLGSRDLKIPGEVTAGSLGARTSKSTPRRWWCQPSQEEWW